MIAPLAALRTNPAAAAGAVAAALLVIAGFEVELLSTPLVIVAFALSYSCGSNASVRGGLLGVGALVVAMQVELGLADFPNVEILVVTVAPWWVGRQVRLRRDLVQALAERNRELEAEQDSFTRLSVLRERSRIAHELHDIVAHHLAVVVVQAGAGRIAGLRGDEPAADRFQSIRERGQQALAEISRLVDIVDGESGPTNPAEERLRTLFEQAEAGGLTLTTIPSLADIQVPVEAEVDLLRILREALTNTIKHAPGAKVLVRLGLTADSLEIEVSDEGGRAPSELADTGSGMGLEGMRERIDALGGTLSAGPTEHGGWRVHAHLPIGGRAPLATIR